MRTEYRTVVRGELAYVGVSIEIALRTWDSKTWDSSVNIGDGISVQQWEQDVMVRDGYLLHINDHGSPYLNPQMIILSE